MSLRLVSAGDETPPVQGKARINGGPIGADTSTASQINKEVGTDESGRIDLGTVPLGKYYITVTSDAAQASFSEEIIIGPEGFENVVIPCPDSRPEPTALSFEFPDLPEENLVVFVSPASGFVVDLFNSRGVALGFILILIPLFYGVLLIISKRIPEPRRKLVSFAVLPVFIYPAYDILSHMIIGYPMTVLQIVFISVYTAALIVLMRRVMIKKFSEKNNSWEDI